MLVWCILLPYQLTCVNIHPEIVNNTEQKSLEMKYQYCFPALCRQSCNQQQRNCPITCWVPAAPHPQVDGKSVNNALSFFICSDFQYWKFLNIIHSLLIFFSKTFFCRFLLSNLHYTSFHIMEYTYFFLGKQMREKITFGIKVFGWCIKLYSMNRCIIRSYIWWCNSLVYCKIWIFYFNLVKVDTTSDSSDDERASPPAVTSKCKFYDEKVYENYYTRKGKRNNNKSFDVLSNFVKFF